MHPSGVVNTKHRQVMLYTGHSQVRSNTERNQVVLYNEYWGSSQWTKPSNVHQKQPGCDANWTQPDDSVHWARPRCYCPVSTTRWCCALDKVRLCCTLNIVKWLFLKLQYSKTFFPGWTHSSYMQHLNDKLFMTHPWLSAWEDRASKVRTDVMS